MANLISWLLAGLVKYWYQIWDQIRAFGDWMFGQMLTAAEGLFPTVNWSGVQDWLDKINYVFPLSEFLVMFTAWFAIWLGVFVYRAVKSWIPTVSGS